MRNDKKLRYLGIERMRNWCWRRLLLTLVLISHFLIFSFPQSQNKRTTKQPAKKTVKAKSQKQKVKSKNTTTSVQALEKQRQQIQQQIKEQERRLRSNEQDVKKRLHNAVLLIPLEKTFLRWILK